MMIAAEKEGIAEEDGDPGAADPRAASPSCPLLSSSRRLHNFSFPTLSWRGQRFLRCSKPSNVATTEPARSADQDHRTSQMKSSPQRPLPVARDPKEEAGREREGREADKASSCAATVAEATRPWNLRTRRAACNFPADRYAMETIDPPSKTVRLQSDESKKGGMEKFSISLSRSEIEEDFFAIKGTKPPRRPKKRAKIVQRELDSLFPGLSLSEITPDSYEVVE
ncbi:hypothetical protein B296_00022566 [Ensete ventricosum]|uniref:Uncharacterized protein n=1 Tax=Ensete ventricosum TaxID=4639 RepID=A0A427AXY8_ENSVE|nr:hypothetical protein B296_00022566 [Ensete ventricosum]